VVAACFLRYVSGKCTSSLTNRTPRWSWLRFCVYITVMLVSSLAAGRCGVQRPAKDGLSALDVGLTRGTKNRLLMHFHA
jgi:hypothetical protein